MEQTKIDEEIEKEEEFKWALMEEQLDREAENEAYLNSLKYELEKFYDEIGILLGNVEEIMDSVTEVDIGTDDTIEEMRHKIEYMNQDLNCLLVNIFDPTLGLK